MLDKSDKVFLIETLQFESIDPMHPELAEIFVLPSRQLTVY